MIKVVLDTNVLVSALISDDGLEAAVLDLALNKRLRLYLSVPILAEYANVLRYKRLALAPERVERTLTSLRTAGILVKPTQTVSASPDETDNRFLECAQAAQADFLVTGNRRHFPRRWQVTQVVNARELLAIISSSFLK